MLFSDTIDLSAISAAAEVLILVVMDAVLWRKDKKVKQYDVKVLILVVMDAVLWHSTMAGQWF